MVGFEMSFANMRDMYILNNERRQSLLDEALKQKGSENQMKFVVDYFLNKLSPSIVAKIDGVSKADILNFKYDYSFLEDYGSFDARTKELREWGNNNLGYSISQVDVDRRGSDKIKIYPAVYALKMGTCAMFASEIQRFSHDFGLESRIVEKLDFCYDKFDGLSVEGLEIHTDRLIKMQHFYNVVKVGGKEYKVDISGFLTAEDFNRSHPDMKVEQNDFYFSDKINSSPYAGLTDSAVRGVLNLLDEHQPQYL